MITTQELIVTRMLMFMMSYCSDVATKAQREYEEEVLEFYANGWCCKSCIASEVGLDNLPYIGIEPGLS